MVLLSTVLVTENGIGTGNDGVRLRRKIKENVFFAYLCPSYKPKLHSSVMKKTLLSLALAGGMLFTACNKEQKTTVNPMQTKVDEFTEVELSADLSHLTEKERQLVGIFIEIGQIMDEMFWEEAFGDKTLMDTITNPAAKAFAMINYGPWERLNDMKPFIEGYGEKPLGANFYPADMTKEEFDALKDENKNSQYTFIRRNDDGSLKVVWYHEMFQQKLAKVKELMEKAIDLAEDKGLKNYLTLRLEAMLTDDYFKSDMAWMDMKESNLDFVVGPIENYEDRLFGLKAAHEAFVLVKDPEWSKKLAKFTAMLPELQKNIPCDPQYKKEVPGTDSDLNVYDVVFYGGDCNAGSKTIAINLPNDERVHIEKGTRRLQLKNAMRAKFDKIVRPIAEKILVKEQLQHVNFDAFFSNVTFHEVAHGLGIKNTVTGKGAVRTALANQYSAWEEAKADILGLYMVNNLIEKGEITNITKEQTFTTFIAGILRSVRFGAASAHGKANMMCFNYFEDHGAFTRTRDGLYQIDFAKAEEALKGWSALILKVEGDGDFEFASRYSEEHGVIRPTLQKELDMINQAGIPRDVRYKQGKDVLGLK